MMYIFCCLSLYFSRKNGLLCQCLELRVLDNQKCGDPKTRVIGLGVVVGESDCLDCENYNRMFWDLKRDQIVSI